MNFPARCLALLALATLPLASQAAQRYRIDLIVFLDRNNAAGEQPEPASVPDVSHALDPLDAGHLKDAGIEMVPDDNFALTDQWKRLQNSRRLEPLLRLAWIQTDPPADHGPALHLRWGAAVPLNTGSGSTVAYPLDGTVALLASHYLHLDADLAYTQPGPDGTPVSYRLKEKRRMKRDELHHLDSPRVGILARVEKADKAEKPKPAPVAPKKKAPVRKKS